MALFNSATAYKNEWSMFEGVVNASLITKDANQTTSTTYALKALWSDGEPDRIPSGQRLGLSPVESALYLWEAGSGLADINHGDTVTIASVVYSIINVRLFRYGYWHVEVTKQETNS